MKKERNQVNKSCRSCRLERHKLVRSLVLKLIQRIELALRFPTRTLALSCQSDEVETEKKERGTHHIERDFTALLDDTRHVEPGRKLFQNGPTFVGRDPAQRFRRFVAHHVLLVLAPEDVDE